ncbi:MAG TPA: RHS repeat domain-containing protein [Pseudomonadales bacterium]
MIIESQPNGDTLGYTYDSAGNRIALTFFAANGSESISTSLKVPLICFLSSNPDLDFEKYY